MLARAYQNIEPYDAAVTQLRDYFDRLHQDGTDWSSASAAADATSQTLNQKPDANPGRVHQDRNLLRFRHAVQVL